MIPLEKTAQVWCICGDLGGGKTLTSVSMMVTAMLRGYYVVSNVLLNDSLLCSLPCGRSLYQHIVVRDEKYDEEGNLLSRVDFNPFTIPSGSPRGSDGRKRVLVVLDECAEWFDQYTSAKSDKTISRVMSWLRHTSKRSQDVVFIVQRREYLQKNFRILVSRWVEVRDLAVWRLPVFKIRLPFMGRLCLATVHDKTGQRIRTPYLINKVEFGQWYDTAQNLSSYGGHSFEYTLPAVRYTVPLFLLFVYVISVFWLLFGF